MKKFIPLIVILGALALTHVPRDLVAAALPFVSSCPLKASLQCFLLKRRHIANPAGEFHKPALGTGLSEVDRV